MRGCENKCVIHFLKIAKKKKNWNTFLLSDMIDWFGILPNEKSMKSPITMPYYISP